MNSEMPPPAAYNWVSPICQDLIRLSDSDAYLWAASNLLGEELQQAVLRSYEDRAVAIGLVVRAS